MLLLCVRHLLGFELDPRLEIFCGFVLLALLWETVREIVRDRNWRNYHSQFLVAGLLVEEWTLLGVAWTTATALYLWSNLPALQALLGTLVVAALVFLTFWPSRVPARDPAGNYAADREAYLRERLSTVARRRRKGGARKSRAGGQGGAG